MTTADSSAIFAAILIVAQFSTIALAAWRCRPRGAASPADRSNAPGITLVRTLKGIENHSAATLDASLSIAYPSFEVLFCVADPADPIVPLVRSAMAAHPNVDARLLFGADRVGANPKLNNMVKGWRQAKYEWICFADSNLLVPPDYLDRLLAAWRSDTGAISAPPAGAAPVDFWGDFECAFLNTFEARWQYAVDTFNFRCVIISA